MSNRSSALPKIFLFILLITALTSRRSFSEEVVPLKVILNHVDMGVTLIVLTDGGDALVPVEDIDKTRLRPGLGKKVTFSGESYLSLKSIPGVDFKVNKKSVALEIIASPRLFQEEKVDFAYKLPANVIYTRANSAFLNYGLFYDTGDDSLDLSTEAGVRLGDWLGTSTFDYLKSPGENKLVRLLTTVTRDDREGLWTLNAGDLTGVSGPLGSAQLQGGIMFSKNYNIDPYLLQFPSLSYSGQLMTPSEVNVYIDGQLFSTERLQPGRFELNNIPAVVGYGRLKVVVKDIFGNETIVSNPFFYTDRLLDKGLHEYRYSLGFVRKGLGEDSFSYGKLAIQGFHDYGFTNKLKGGFALEASGGLISAGPTASVLISHYGVLDAAFAYSVSEGKYGYGAFLNYLFKSRPFTATASLRAVTRYFSNLSSSPFDDKSSILFNTSAGLALKSIGTVTLEFSASRPYENPSILRYGLLYDRNITRRINVFARVSRTEEEGGIDSNELFVGLHVYFGANTSGSINYANDGGVVTRTASVQKNLPLGAGYGYRAQVDNRAEGTDFSIGGDYQNDYGVYGLSYSDASGAQSAQFAASGGIGYIDGTTFASRPITDSFAKVKVGDLEGVRVRYYNNDVAKTDKNGSVIIPVINSYRENRIDIEKGDIPIEYSIGAVTKNINPPLRSGSLVEFKLEKIQALSGKIYTIDGGVKVPVEFSVMKVILDDRIIEGLVGEDGEFYIENVPAGSRTGEVLYKGKTCDFKIEIPESKDVIVEIGAVICEAQR